MTVRLRTLDDAAAELACSRRTVERWIAAGELATVRVGRTVRVSTSALDRFIAAHETTTGVPPPSVRKPPAQAVAGKAPRVPVEPVLSGRGGRLWDRT